MEDTKKRKVLVLLWCTPKVRVNSNSWGVFFMAKYNEQFKFNFNIDSKVKNHVKSNQKKSGQPMPASFYYIDLIL